MNEKKQQLNKQKIIIKHPSIYNPNIYLHRDSQNEHQLLYLV